MEKDQQLHDKKQPSGKKQDQSTKDKKPSVYVGKWLKDHENELHIIMIGLFIILLMAFIRIYIGRGSGNSIEQSTEAAIAERYGLEESEVSSLTPKAEYIYVDYDSIANPNQKNDSDFKYDVILDTDADGIYFATPGCSKEQLGQESIMAPLYNSNGNVRKVSDKLTDVVGDKVEKLYPVVAATKYYKFIKLDESNYCEVYSGVIYEKNVDENTFLPVFTANNVLFTYNDFIQEK